MHKNNILWAFTILLATLPLAHASTFYKWVDAAGATHYSQQPQYNIKHVETVNVYKDPESFSSASQRLNKDDCELMRRLMPRVQAHMYQYDENQRARIDRAMDIYEKNCS